MRYKKADNPQCQVRHCVNNSDGGCVALTTSDFGDRACPFYKPVVRNPVEQLKEMLEFYRNSYFRLQKDYEILNRQYKQVRKEADDLIEAYEKLKEGGAEQC